MSRPNRQVKFWMRSYLRVAGRPLFHLLRRLGVDFDCDTLALGLRLGLGDLSARNLCSGYSTACVCAECSERAKSVSPEFLKWLEREDDPEKIPSVWRPVEHPAQPWDSKAAA